MKLVIVSGQSGAGKSVALRQLEDLGFFCVDNMPLALVGPLNAATLQVIEQGYDRLALGIDAREAATQIREFPRYVEHLRKLGVDVRVLFLTADEATIVRRYSETRRRHPLTGKGLSLNEAIAAERELLEPIAASADEVIETSTMNVHELREEITYRMSGSAAGHLSLNFLSFGYKNGVPGIADYVFDVRCLPNPHWEPGLREYSGLDAPVQAFLSGQPAVQEMLGHIRGFLERWLPEFERQDRAYLTVAIGCTGGRHRSVYIAEALRATFADRFEMVVAKHRELGHG